MAQQVCATNDAAVARRQVYALFGRRSHSVHHGLTEVEHPRIQALRLVKFDPSGRVIARILTAANLAIDSGADKPWRDLF